MVVGRPRPETRRHQRPEPRTKNGPSGRRARHQFQLPLHVNQHPFKPVARAAGGDDAGERREQAAQGIDARSVQIRDVAVRRALHRDEERHPERRLEVVAGKHLLRAEDHRAVAPLQHRMADADRRLQAELLARPVEKALRTCRRRARKLVEVPEQIGLIFREEGRGARQELERGGPRGRSGAIGVVGERRAAAREVGPRFVHEKLLHRGGRGRRFRGRSPGDRGAEAVHGLRRQPQAARPGLAGAHRLAIAGVEGERGHVLERGGRLEPPDLDDVLAGLEALDVANAGRKDVRGTGDANHPERVDLAAVKRIECLGEHRAALETAQVGVRGPDVLPQEGKRVWLDRLRHGGHREGGQDGRRQEAASTHCS